MVLAAFNHSISIDDFYALSNICALEEEGKILSVMEQLGIKDTQSPIAFVRNNLISSGTTKKGVSSASGMVDKMVSGLEGLGRVDKVEKVSSFRETSKGIAELNLLFTVTALMVGGLSLLTFGAVATLSIAAAVGPLGIVLSNFAKKFEELEEKAETDDALTQEKKIDEVEKVTEDVTQGMTETETSVLDARAVENLINAAKTNTAQTYQKTVTRKDTRYELNVDINQGLVTLTNMETHMSVDIKIGENMEKIAATVLNVMDAMLMKKSVSEEKAEIITAKTFDAVASRVKNAAANEVKEIRGVVTSVLGAEYEVKVDLAANKRTLRSMATGVEVSFNMLKLNEISTLSAIETVAKIEMNSTKELQQISDKKVNVTTEVFDAMVMEMKNSELGSAIDMVSANLTRDGGVFVAKMNLEDAAKEKSFDGGSLIAILHSMGKISDVSDTSATQNKIIRARVEYKGAEYEMNIDTADNTLTVLTNRTMDTKRLRETINLMFNALNMKANTLKVEVSGLDANTARDKAKSILSAGVFKVFDMSISGEKTSLGDLLAAEKVILEKETVRAENALNSIETSVNTSLKTQANEITDRVISEKLANLPENEIRGVTQRVYDGYRGIIRGDLKYVLSMEGKGDIVIDGRNHVGERLIDVLVEKLGLSGSMIERMTKEFGGILPYEAGGVIVSENGELRHRPAVKAVIKIAANGELLKLGETDVFKKSDNIVFQYHTHPDVATDVRQYLADWLNVIAKADFFGIEADQMVPMNIYEMGKDSKIAEIKRLFAEKDATGKMRMVLEKFNSETGRFETMEEFGRIFEELDVSSMITRTTMPDAAEEKRFTASLNGVVLDAVIAPVGIDAITGIGIFEFTIARPMNAALELRLSPVKLPTIVVSPETKASFVTALAQKLIQGGETMNIQGENVVFELDSEGNIHVTTLAEIDGETVMREQIVPAGEVLEDMVVVKTGLDKLTSSEQETFETMVAALTGKDYSPEDASEVLMTAIPKADRTMDRSEATEVEPKERVIPSVGVDETAGYGEYLLRAKEAVTNWMSTAKNYFRSLPVLIKQTGETPIVKIQGIMEKDAPISEITGEQIIRLLKQDASVKDMLKQAQMLLDKGFVSLVGEKAVTTDKKGFMEMLKSVDANNKRRVLEGKKARNVIVIVGEGEANREIRDLVSKYSGSVMYSSANRVNGAVRETFAAMDVPKLRITGITTKADSPNVQSRILNLADTYVLADAKGAIFGLVLVLMVTQKSDFTCAYTAAAAEKIERIIKNDSQKANRPTITFTGANNANTNEMIDQFLSDLTEAEVSF